MEKIIFGLDQTSDGIKVSSDCVRSFYTHTHVYHEMLCYEPFDGFITVNEQRISVDTHTILFLTPNDFHSTTLLSAGDARYMKIAFRTDMVDPYLSTRLSSPIVFSNYTAHALSTALVNKVATQPPLPHLHILVNALLWELSQEGQAMGASLSRGRKLLVSDAVRIINEHFFEHLSLQAVATQLHVTPQHLSSTFSRQIGVSFSAYLRDKRLKYAADLLKTHKLTMTEVCYRCGFENLSHFIRSFKSQYGVSPRNYVKQQESSQEKP